MNLELFQALQSGRECQDRIAGTLGYHGVKSFCFSDTTYHTYTYHHNASCAMFVLAINVKLESSTPATDGF